MYAMARTAFVVDDHPSFRACARECLTDQGFDVVGDAEDGSSALEAVRRLRPDLIILDIQLPDMSGFDVASQLTVDGYDPDIVLVSSRDAEDYGPLIEQSGARGFIAKADLTAEAVVELLA
jgi:DNA-binding NarL/FixJ family response regulator